MAKKINNTTNNETINNTNTKENKTMKKANKDYTLNGTINATTWQEFRTVMKEAGINTATKSYEQLAEEYEYRNREFCVLWEDNNGKALSEMFKTKNEALDKADELNNGKNDCVNAYHIVDGKYIEIFREGHTHKVIGTDHAYYNEKFTAFTGTYGQCKEYVKENCGPTEGGDANLVTYTIVQVGDMSEDRYTGEINPAPNKPKYIIDRKHGDYIVKSIVKASFVATKGDSKGKRILTMHKLFGIFRKAYTNNLNDKLEESFIKDIINQLVKLQYIGFKKYESGAIVFYPTTKAANYK